MKTIVDIKNVSKVYDSGFKALDDVSLSIKQGEVIALLGPNGAGKTTLISLICGLVKRSSGQVLVNGFDNVIQYRDARNQIGLVPQELTLGLFETVIDTVKFSRGLFGKEPNQNYIDQLLKDLSIFDKKNDEIRSLSGGMKRRVLIAKALSHEPTILFLDEPSAGVDVELRKDMWNVVRKLSDQEVTIILTTHYIEEAEAIADRVAIISNGKIILVDEQKTLMKKLGKHQLVIEMEESLQTLPENLDKLNLDLSEDGRFITYCYDAQESKPNFASILKKIGNNNIDIKDLQTSKSSLEDIFIDLVKD